MAGKGVFTDAYRERLAAAADSGLPANATKLAYFQIGEAGLDPGSTPPDPDPSFTELVAQTQSPTGPFKDRFYQKTLLDGDVSHAGNVLTVVCQIDANEGNGTPDSHYFEVGIFDSEDVMIAYCTFDDQHKDSSKALKNTVNITL